MDNRSTSSIEKIIEDLKMKKYRDSTKKNYYAIWKMFNNFFIRLDRKPREWDQHLTLFVAYLIDNKKPSSTVKSYISAIKVVLQDNGIELQENQCLLTSVTRACHLTKDKVRQQLPIGKVMLSVILRHIDIYFSHNNHFFLQTLYKCLFSSMYFGLFRIGELTASPHVVKVCDVRIAANKRKMQFILRSSKTHSTNIKPQLIYILSHIKLTILVHNFHVLIIYYSNIFSYVETTTIIWNSFLFSEMDHRLNQYMPELVWNWFCSIVALTTKCTQSTVFKQGEVEIYWNSDCQSKLLKKLDAGVLMPFMLISDSVPIISSNFNIISGSVPAFFDAWFVGDKVREDVSTSLRVMLDEAAGNKKLPQPYLHEIYNVHTFTEHLSSENVLACTLNALMWGINEKKQLPRFLVILLDKDLISALNVFQDDIIPSLRDTVAWYVCQINIIIRCKRIDLLAEKPGSIYRADPSIIFVWMICRVDLNLYHGSKLDIVYSLWAKFNDSLNDAVDRIGQHIMTINSSTTAGHFDSLGNLSHKGKMALWLEMDDLLARFDKKEIKLLPNPVNNKPVHRVNHHTQQNHQRAKTFYWLALPWAMANVIAQVNSKIA